MSNKHNTVPESMNVGVDRVKVGNMSVGISNNYGMGGAFRRTGCPCSGVLTDGQYSYTIEEHMESFAGDPVYGQLWYTWCSDKPDYINRLKTIVRNFDNYTMHDESHSRAILSRIEALLGEQRIRLLSPTDTWLLLECAYTHDFGMCVDDVEKTQFMTNEGLLSFLKSKEFIQYLESVDRAHHDLKNRRDSLTHSVRFMLRRVRDASEKGSWDDLTNLFSVVRGGGLDKAKMFLHTALTDYFRRRHADRTYDMLMKEIHAASNKHTFPPRLREIVALIDKCHGEPWEEILTAFKDMNSGIGTDLIHPQFIAALLRLGDLLDLESHRVNDRLNAQISLFPDTSLCHMLKHISISEYLVDEDRIAIVARYRYEHCEQYLTELDWKPDQDNADDCGNKKEIIHRLMNESAKGLFQWVDWIDQDLRHFSHYWNRIVPDNMPGTIAYLEPPIISIDDIPVDYDELQLRYQISERRAMQIAEGSGLYNNPLSFIREFTQNACDTTRMQIYRFLKFQNSMGSVADEGGKKKVNITFRDVLSVIEKAPVKVEIQFIPHTKYGESDEIEFRFIDHGTGITFEKLRTMRDIGAIILPNEEQRDLDDMPEWMKPTGEFGIGMQSAFSVVDKLRIETYPRQEIWDGKQVRIKRTIQMNSFDFGGDIVNYEETVKEKTGTEEYGSTVIIRMQLTDDILVRLFNCDLSQTQSIGYSNPQIFYDILLDYIKFTFTYDVIPIRFTFKGFGFDKPIDYCFPAFSWAPLRSESECFLTEQDDQVHFLYHQKQPNVQNHSMLPKTPDTILLTLSNADKNKKFGRVKMYFKGIRVCETFDTGIHRKNNSTGSREARMFDLFRMPNVDVSINIMSGRAGDFLQINRDHFKEESFAAIVAAVRNAYREFSQAFVQSVVSNDGNGFCYKLNECSCFMEMILQHLIFVMMDDSKPSYENIMKWNEQSKTPITDYLIGKEIAPQKEHPSNEDWLKDFQWFSNANGYKGTLSWSYDDNARIMAMEDYTSALLGEKYEEIHVVRKNDEYQTPILFYRLKAKNVVFPTITDKEFAVICGDIVTQALREYREADEDNKYNIGRRYLSFPANKANRIIAVDKYPADSGDDKLRPYNRFVLCPFTVEQLVESVCYTDEDPDQKIHLAIFDMDKLKQTGQTDPNQPSQLDTFVKYLADRMGIEDQTQIENMKAQYIKFMGSLCFIVAHDKQGDE